VRRRDTSLFLRWISLIFIFAAVVLALIQLVSYSRLRSYYPEGMSIAGIPVGGLDAQTASQRLLEVYTRPVEIHYAGTVIDLNPTVAGFEMDIESMLAAADLQRTGSGFWTGFWDYLWNRQPTSTAVPLLSQFSEDRLRAYLKDEIATRYDQPATPAQPVPGRPEFQPGEPGQELDITRAIPIIEDALRSPTNRVVSLTFQRTTATRPTLQNLRILLQQIIEENNYDGTVGVFMRDLQSGDEMHFGYRAGQDLSVDPTDIAFTASSTIKIPILVSVYRQFGPKLDEETAQLVLGMIQKSENPPSDALMQKLDPERGPLFVTDTMETIGLQSTFLAGYFYVGAPQLRVYKTPANQRTDVNTDPDSYSQTTPIEIGMLLKDIYDCSQNGGGTLVAAFPGKVTQQACQEMIDYLKTDNIGVLIQAGVPEGTQVAHKHGWVSDSAGIIQNVSDAAIVYTPGGNYILTIYLYHPVQVLFDSANALVAQMSQAVYNYFNLPAQ
jgi:beta-lactamase class A